MACPRDTYFDVKTVSVKPIPDGIGPRSVNLMCAILEGVTYGELYDEPLHFKKPGIKSALDKIIDNTNCLHPDLQKGAATEEKIVIEKLAGTSGAFVQIRLALESTESYNIKLKKLFYTDIYGGIITQKKLLLQIIVGILEDVHTPNADGEDQMFHFCAPFLTVQKKRQLPARKKKPTKDAFGRLMSNFRNHTMQQFFDKHTGTYDRTVREAAIDALKHSILKEHGRPNKPPFAEVAADTIRIMSSDGNSRCCQGAGQGCGISNDPEDWCNDYVSEGVTYCSLGSDSC